MEVALEADDLRRLDPAPVGVLAGDLDRALVGLGAGVGEEDPAAEARLGEALGEAHHRLGVEEVGDVHQAAGLLAHGLDHGGVAVADRADRDPGEEVEVLLALGVPEQGALAADELDRRAPVGPHQVALLEGLEVGEVHGVTIVPMPASVKSSSSSECGLRPSMMWADWAPPRIASTQAPSLGRMPPSIAGSRSSTSATVAREISEPGVGGIGEPALDVGEEDRLVGAERGGDLAGGLVGVDVVGLAGSRSEAEEAITGM